MKYVRTIILFVIAIATALFSATPLAIAYNAQQFRTNVGPLGTFSLRGSQPGPSGEMQVGISANYGKDPLVLRNQTSNSIRFPIVDHIFTSSFNAQAAFHERLGLSVDVPVTFTHHIPSDGTGLTESSDFRVGDIRVEGLVSLVRPEDASGFGLGIIPFVEIPSGNAPRFTGDAKVAFGGILSLDAQVGRFYTVANIGYRQRANEDIQVIGFPELLNINDEVTYGLGMAVNVVPKHLDIVAEVQGASKAKKFFNNREVSPLEAMGGIRAKWLDEKLVLTAGVGGALVRGHGAAQVRGLTGLSYRFGVKSNKVAHEPRLVRTIVLYDVHFLTDKFTLTEQGRAVLHKNIANLQANPNLTLQIEGHADARGTDQYNQRLSENRANSVFKYFVSAGLSPVRMSTVGYGESRPRAPNDSAINLAKNRRVEIHIME